MKTAWGELIDGYYLMDQYHIWYAKISFQGNVTIYCPSKIGTKGMAVKWVTYKIDSDVKDDIKEAVEEMWS